MKKKIVKILSIVLVIVTTFSVTTISSYAASYPTAFFVDNNFEDLIVEDSATVGDYVSIRMEWFAVFKNEGYDLVIRDSNGGIVSTASDKFINDSYKRNITVGWDTRGLESGKYTVEVTLLFYSNYDWHEAPTTKKLFIVLNPSPQAVESGSSPQAVESNQSLQKESKPKKTTLSKIVAGKKSFKATWKKVNGVNGYQVQYSTDKKFKKNKKTDTIKKNKTTSKTVKKLKAKKKYYVRIRTYKNAKQGDKTVKVYSSWSKAKTVKTK